jgi:chromosome partitioning protein
LREGAVPAIVFISPKGGVGKTTASLVLDTQFAKHGAAVTMIDANPNRPLRKWGTGAHCPENLSIVSNVHEESILDVIDAAASTTPFVIVDLEGTAAKIALLAVSQASLVIIPMQPSNLDADQASRALVVIAQQQRMSRRKVPHAVLFTRTSTGDPHPDHDAHRPVAARGGCADARNRVSRARGVSCDVRFQ